jgi:hypothetical protein
VILPVARVKKAKYAALALLAAITLAAPIVETLMAGRVESFSAYDLGATFVSLLPIYWWYHVDKAEHGYRAGPLMNAGVGLVAVIALPVYFVRTRGWKRGGIATAIAAAFAGALYLIEWLGEALGGFILGRLS